MNLRASGECFASRIVSRRLSKDSETTTWRFLVCQNVVQALCNLSAGKGSSSGAKT
jgi:hypothetical protein